MQIRCARARPTKRRVLLDYEQITAVNQDGVLVLTLNRPAARNSLSRAMLAALAAEFAAIAADDGVRAVVLAGNGPAFSAGHDLKEMRANPGRYASCTITCRGSTHDRRR